LDRPSTSISRQIARRATLNYFPQTGNPLGPAGTSGGTFTFTGYLVTPLRLLEIRCAGGQQRDSIVTCHGDVVFGRIPETANSQSHGSAWEVKGARGQEGSIAIPYQDRDCV
jgi:hypothetical protein